MTPIPKPSRRTIAQLVLVAVLSMGFAVFQDLTTIYHKRSFDNAFFKWNRDPTPENERIFRREQQQLFHERNVIMMRTASVTFLLVNMMVFVTRGKGRAAALSLFLSATLIVMYTGLPDGKEGSVWFNGIECTLQQWRIAMLVVWAITLVILGLTLRRRTTPHYS